MESSMYTKISVGEAIFSWTISNFSLNGKTNGEFIKSPTFETKPGNFKWYMLIYPKGYTDGNSNYVSLYLFSVNSNEVKKGTQFSFAIRDSRGKEVNTYTDIKTFEGTSGQGSGRFILISDLKDKNYLINDKLTIICKVRSGINFVEEPSSSKPINLNDHTDQLSQDFQVLLDNEKLSDITLIVKKRRFNVHKVILSARSPVFSALFEHDMQEKIENTVYIKDADPEVIAEMLRYIYTGKVQNVETTVVPELLGIADKYALEGLKLICEDILCGNLTVENALAMLNLADLYRSEKLKKTTITFVIAHANEITDTQEYTSFKNSELLSEMFRALALKRVT